MHDGGGLARLEAVRVLLSGKRLRESGSSWLECMGVGEGPIAKDGRNREQALCFSARTKGMHAVACGRLYREKA